MRHIERKRNIPPNHRNTHYTVFASIAKQTPGRVVKNYVILNEVKNPTEELTGQRTARLFVRELFP